MGEKIVEMRNDEITKREAFLREYGRHLPRDFAPGLTEKPSHCNVSMRPFDTVDIAFYPSTHLDGGRIYQQSKTIQSVTRLASWKYSNNDVKR